MEQKEEPRILKLFSDLLSKFLSCSVHRMLWIILLFQVYFRIFFSRSPITQQNACKLFPKGEWGMLCYIPVSVDECLTYFVRDPVQLSFHCIWKKPGAGAGEWWRGACFSDYLSLQHKKFPFAKYSDSLNGLWLYKAHYFRKHFISSNLSLSVG